MLSMTRYAIKTESLSPWIKFIWHFNTEDVDIHYKLLPTDSIDIILNLSDGIVYEVNSHCIPATPFHINGLRSKYNYIHQTGSINIFGISFHSFGLYPFVHKSLIQISDKIVDLFELSSTLAKKLDFAVSNGTCAESIVENIENVLCKTLQVNNDFIYKADIIRDFLEMDGNATIQSFCLEQGLHHKTFMRNVLCFTGYTPKLLRSIKRFQEVGNQLIRCGYNQLAEIAFDNNFADQAHFTRDFRKFSGASPRAFQGEKITIKENVTYNYL